FHRRGTVHEPRNERRDLHRRESEIFFKYLYNRYPAATMRGDDLPCLSIRSCQETAGPTSVTIPEGGARPPNARLPDLVENWKQRLFTHVENMRPLSHSVAQFLVSHKQAHAVRMKQLTVPKKAIDPFRFLPKDPS